jgi:hypothetical protein
MTKTNNTTTRLDPAVLNPNDSYQGHHSNPAVKNSVGIIQSRGLGDLFIALPIAKWYADRGHTVYWPICEEFFTTMSSCAPWVNWIRMKTDQHGKFFYDSAKLALKYIVAEADHVCLYQYLSNMPELSDPATFPILKFDQYKYAAAGVPFLEKWRLAACIVRNRAEEDRVYRLMVKKPRYIVAHLEGSDRRVELDWREAVQQGYQVVEIREGITDNATAWLKVIEGAEYLYMIDSCYSNLVDQLGIEVEKTFIRRSKMDLTPVLGGSWSYMSPP